MDEIKKEESTFWDRYTLLILIIVIVLMIIFMSYKSMYSSFSIAEARKEICRNNNMTIIKDKTIDTFGILCRDNESTYKIVNGKLEILR